LALCPYLHANEIALRILRQPCITLFLPAALARSGIKSPPTPAKALVCLHASKLGLSQFDPATFRRMFAAFDAAA